MNERRMVPFGYKEPESEIRGTLIMMDSFDEFSHKDFQELLRVAEERKFSRIVLYPFHDQTLKRMGMNGGSAYFSRIKELESILEGEGTRDIPIHIDLWEGKRKKYTPMDSSLGYLTEKYGSPHFLMVNSDQANQFAGFHGFEVWLRKIRLLIRASDPFMPHSLLTKHPNRWDLV